MLGCSPADTPGANVLSKPCLKYRFFNLARPCLIKHVAGFSFPAVEFVGGQGAALHARLDGLVHTVVYFQDMVLFHQLCKGLLWADDVTGLRFAIRNAGAIV